MLVNFYAKYLIGSGIFDRLFIFIIAFIIILMIKGMKWILKN